MLAWPCAARPSPPAPRRHEGGPAGRGPSSASRRPALCAAAPLLAALQRRRQRLWARCAGLAAEEASWHDAWGDPPLPPVGEAPERFELGDARGALAHLRRRGFAVFGCALTDREISLARGLFWDFVEGFTGGSVARGRVETWDPQWPGQPDNGIINRGIGMSRFMWYLRRRPAVLRAFAGLWSVPPGELVVSLDGACAFRPPGVNPAWRTRAGWLHTDQNGHTRGNGFEGLQGCISLTASDESTGGFVCLPGSHLRHSEVFERWPLKRRNDFFVLPRSDPLLSGPAAVRARLVRLAAGDMVVWDSRCIHSNVPAVHPFDAAPLRVALEEAGLGHGGVAKPLLRELTSVADAARLRTLLTDRQLRGRLLALGVPDRQLADLERALRRWSSQLGADAREGAAGGEPRLARLAAYVSFCPRRRVEQQQLRAKRCAALLGATTTHWPDRAEIADVGIGDVSLHPAELGLSELRLLGCESSERAGALGELLEASSFMRASVDAERAELLHAVEARLHESLATSST